MEKQLSSAMIYDGRILKLRRDEAQAHNGAACVREVVEHPGGAAIVPLTDDGRVICVRQFRYPFMEELLEIPAGKLERGEQPYDCAVRELEEETGYQAEEFIYLGPIYSSPGFCDEKIHIYLARGLRPGHKHFDEDEYLENEAYTPEQLEAMALEGTLRDSKTLAALTLIRGYLKREENDER